MPTSLSKRCLWFPYDPESDYPRSKAALAFITKKLDEELLLPSGAPTEQQRSVVSSVCNVLTEHSAFSVVVSNSHEVLTAIENYLPAVWALNQEKSAYVMGVPEMVSWTRFGDDGDWSLQRMQKYHLMVFSRLNVDYPGLRKQEGRITQALIYRTKNNKPTVVTMHYNGSSFQKQTCKNMFQNLEELIGQAPALLIQEKFSVEDFPVEIQAPSIRRWGT